MEALGKSVHEHHKKKIELNVFNRLMAKHQQMGEKADEEENKKKEDEEEEKEKAKERAAKKENRGQTQEKEKVQ